MTIYIHDNGDGYVEFYVYDSNYEHLEEAFIKCFGQRPKTSYPNVYVVMSEIDSWYTDRCSEGCVRFEFD